MIWESWFWKRELIDLLGQLDTWGPRQAENWNEDRWGGEAYFRLERSVFYSSLVIRRLLESDKVTDKLASSSFPLTVLPSKISGPTKLMHFKGADDLLAEFDFDAKAIEMFAPRKLTAEIIHSYTLEFYVNDAEDNIDGFFVASQQNNYKRLVDVPIKDWRKFVAQFAEDEISKISVHWGKGDAKIVTYKE
jgi:hypothetical protein